MPLKTSLPSFILRTAANLQDQSTPDLLRLTSVVIENARQFFAALGGGQAAAEVDAIYRPFVDELMRRSVELEAMPSTPRERMSAAVAGKIEPRWFTNLYELRQRVRWTMLIRIYVRRTTIIGRGPRSVPWMQAALRRWRLITPAMAPRGAGR